MMKSIKVFVIGVFTVASLFAMVNCNKTDLTDLTNSVADMKKQNDILLQLTHKLQASLDSVHNVVNQNNTLLNNINNKVSALQTAVSGLIANITTLSTKIDSVNVNINSVQLQLKTLTTQFQSLSSQINSVFSSIMIQIDSLSTQVNVNTILINKLQAEYLTTQINVNTILLAIQTNNQLLTANNANVAQIQLQLISLTNQYNNVITLLNQLINLVSYQTVMAGLNNGLIAYYPFTGNAGDSSGNGNHGTVNGATLASDRFGNANGSFSFNGSSFISTNLLPPTGNSSRSFSLWFKFSDFSGFNACSLLSYGANSGDCSQAGGNFSLELYKNTFNSSANFRWDGVCSAVQYENNINSSWHHVTVIYDPQFGSSISNGKIYIDGAQVSKATYNGSTNVNTLLLNKLKIGMSVSTNSRFFQGQIDDIRIYNRVLTESEIQYLATH